MELVFGDYRAEKKIGRSDASTFYLAVHAVTGRRAVVKFLKFDSGPGTSRESLKLLAGEAEIARSLEYPGIVGILDVGQIESGLFIAMNPDPGIPLDRLLSAGPGLDHTRAAQIAFEAGKALASAHGKGVFHKNLKPSNIFIRDNGAVTVADFGLGRVADPMDSGSGSVDLSSSPCYLAPEQVSGDLDMVDQRTDVYSLGVILYEMITCSKAFDPSKPGAIQYKILKTSPPAPRSVDRRIPKELEAVCLKAMNPQMHLRYWSIAEMAMDLKRFLEGGRVSAMGEALHVRILSFIAGSRTRIAAMAVAALVLSLAGFVIAKGVMRSKARRDGPPKQAQNSESPGARSGQDEARAALMKRLDDALSAGLSRDIADRRIAAIRKILKEAPDFAPALAHLGFTLVFTGRLRQGMDALAKASEKDPGLGLTGYFWGFVYFHFLKTHDRALSEWRKAAEGSLSRPETHLAAAWAAFAGKRDIEAAIDSLSRAQDRGAADWEISLLLGYIHQTRPGPKNNEALKEYRKVINDTAGFPPALFLRAKVLIAAGLPAEAEDSLVRAVAFAPSYPDANILLAEMLISRSEWDRAVKHADAALDILPDCREALLLRTECLLGSGKTKEALAGAEKAVEAAPGTADALFLRARVHAALKDADAADRDFTAAIKAAPSEWRFSYGYALFLEGIGSADEAVRYLQKTVDAKPDFIEALLRKAGLHFKLEEFDKSLADYQAVLRLDPTVAKAYVGAANIYIRHLKNPSMARDYLESGLRFCADRPGIEEIRKLLDLVSDSAGKSE